MADTKIEWTDKTWNPVRGRAIVSPGCKNCYAMRFAHRFSGKGQRYAGLTVLKGNGPVWTGRARPVMDHDTRDLREATLFAPLRWQEPERIFVNSMSDLFHEDVPFEFIAAVYGVMGACRHHTFQVLTKRQDRMLAFYRWVEGHADRPAERVVAGYAKTELNVDGSIIEYAETWPLPNLMLGVSVEDQRRANERIPVLLRTPAAVRFISAEPLLEAIDLTDIVTIDRGAQEHRNALDCDVDPVDDEDWQGATLDWVIVGGESGNGARPFHVEWAAALVEQCSVFEVPIFVKQLGKRPFRGYVGGGTGEALILRDKKGGDMDEWPAPLRVRAFPQARGQT